MNSTERLNQTSNEAMWSPKTLKRVIVVTGHYGSGKTNFSLNLAHEFARAGEQVTLVDLDIVNPYFRSSDYDEELIAEGIRLIAPTFAHTTIESPALPAEISAAFITEGRVIFDVGGDDAGATALGRYREEFADLDFDFLYVINARRNLTGKSDEAVEILREIEGACGLKATGIVNNTHLQEFTDCAIIENSSEFAHGVEKATGSPLLCSTLPVALLEEASCVQRLASAFGTLYPVQILVCPPWGK